MEIEYEREHAELFKYLSIAVHGIGSAHFIFGCYYDWFYVIVPTEVSPIYSAFGYKLKFLTYWNALTQASYFTFCFITDITGTKDETRNQNSLSKIKDYIETAIAFPIAMFVGFTFWILMAVDRELVLPAAVDPYFPAWLNHLMHTNIVIFQILEFITSSRNYPRRIYGMIGLFLYQTVYLIWMHVVHYKSGYWVYGVLEKLNIPEKMCFFTGSIFLGFVFYFIGEILNRILWIP